MKDEVPSQTSLLIARLVLLVGGDAYGRRILPPGCLEAQIQLLKACDLPLAQYPWLLCNPFCAKISRWLSVFLTGVGNLVSYIGFRKAWIEHQTRMALKSGASQVLVMAAGYDTLAYRLAPEFEHVSFVELDHPATGKVKLAGLSKMKFPSNLHTIHADLTKNKLSDVLSHRVFFDPTKTTVVIMEGLLAYLTAETIKELFAELAKVVGPESLSLITFRESVQLGWANSFFMARLKRWGEPVQWQMHPSNIADFFQGTRWRLSTVVESRAFYHVVGLTLKDDK